MELHLHKYEQEQWVVVSPDGMILLHSLKARRTDSIKIFMSFWDKSQPVGKWTHWKRKGYTCQKVELTVKPK